MISTLCAPFPYFGGKRRVADEVWRRFGHVVNYVEPFAGSAAMLLVRPDSHRWWERTETINDADGFVSNFWRAVRAAPDQVAAHADWPVNENDLHARHAWLIERAADLRPRLEGNPDFYDAKIAGWWVWGMCAWIGSGWCSGAGPWQVVDGKLVHLGDEGRGLNRKLVHLGDEGRGLNRKLVHLGDEGRGLADTWAEHLRAMMARLSDRLRRVRVASGDWHRVLGPSVTTKHGVTAVFLDPPYAHAERSSDLYRVEMPLAADVRAWAIEHGGDPLLRIALCGYDGEHAMPEDWTAHRWKAAGGFGSQGDARGRDNAARETVWLSPHCEPAESEQRRLI